MTFEVDHNADGLGHTGGLYHTVWRCKAPEPGQWFRVVKSGWDKDVSIRTIYEWVDATSHTHGGTNPVEQRPGAADNESAAGGVPHTDANTVPFTPSAVQEYLDHAIHEWRKVRDTVGAGGNTDLAAAYIDAFQSVRSSLFGSLCPLREDHSNAC